MKIVKDWDAFGLLLWILAAIPVLWSRSFSAVAVMVAIAVLRVVALLIQMAFFK